MTTTDFTDPGAVRSDLRAFLAEHATPERLADFDEREVFDVDLYRSLVRAGFLRLDADPGVHGPSHRGQAIVLEELGATATSIGVACVVQFMGVQLLETRASAEQKATWLDPLYAGDMHMSFALSEPDGGTDVARAMKTTARRHPDGGWVIAGAKKWIGAANHSDFLIVLARTAPIERSSIDGITMFIVPTRSLGVSASVIDTVGIRGLEQNDLVFHDVRVGDEALVGEEGRGFRYVLATLNGERLNAAAVALGIGRGALDAAVAWAKSREAFGRPVGAFQALQHSLVDAAMEVEAARLMLESALVASDEAGEPDEVPSAMAKLAASRAGTTASDVGMRVMAGWGFARFSPMQRYFRDARLYTFAPLTDEMVKNYIGEKLLGLPRSF